MTDPATKMAIPYGTPHPDPCPRCNSKLILRPTRFGPAYLCENYGKPCNGSASAHKNGEPLGTAVDKGTKAIRVLVHNMLDPYWKFRPDSAEERTRLYCFMTEQMKMDEFHIGQLDIEQLRIALKIIQREVPKYFTRK